MRSSRPGFTVTELMTTVVIILILVGAGIPTYLGVRRSAWDAQARAALEAVSNDLRSLTSWDQGRPEDGGDPFAEDITVGKYPVVAPDDWDVPPYDVVAYDTPSEEPEVVSVGNVDPDSGEVPYAGASDAVILVTKSRSGRCFVLVDSLVGPQRSAIIEADDSRDCAADSFSVADTTVDR